MGRGSSWWVGDWIRYGNAKFGERYVRAAKITGYDVQTLTNMVYVASRFEISRRRENLSWSHHETVAALEPDEQGHWLNRAIAEKLSVSDLRLELRSSRPKTSAANDDESSTADMLVCPCCGNEVPVSHTGVTSGPDRLSRPNEPSSDAVGNAI
jgi:hypothetical protein